MKRLSDPASAYPALLSMAGITLFAVLFLHAESQETVLGLIASAVVILLLLARFGWNARAAASFAGHSRAGNAAVLIGALLVVAAFYDQHFPLLMLASVLLYIVVCLGLNLQFGYAGVVNFAGAAFFGIGCYTAAVLTEHTALPHLLVILAGGVMAAAIGSLLILPVLRTYGHYAALVTIAFGILFRVFLEVNDALGGPQGMKLPGMEIFGWKLNDGLVFGDVELSFYANYVLVALVMAAFAFMLVRRLERSWIGLNLDAVRLDETACAAFGIDVARWKITAFTMGNFLAGLAGSVYAMMTGFVAPNSFTFGDSLILVSIVILGGIGNPWGLTVAAAIVLILPEKLQFIQEYRLLLYAGLVILILLFRPGGLMPRQVRNYLPRLEAMNDTLLACEGLSMRFGGLVALNQLSLSVNTGEILGLIGPNGSGKTTFFNVITGIYQASAGRVDYCGHDLARMSAQEIYRAGVTRTFQRSRLCLPLSIFDNLMIGNHRRLDHGLWFNLIRRGAFRRQFEEQYAQAQALVRTFSQALAGRLFEPAASVNMIDRRRIEICRALISQPTLLLLDEPSAGMTHEETRELMDDILIVREHMPGLSIIIVEHEMNVIERITERCIVLNFGQKICEGPYASIAADAQVQEAYLGTA